MTITSVLLKIGGILNVIIPILITLGVIYFIWGVIKYVTAKDEEQQKEGRTTIVSGIVGLFVIVAIWGLVGILQNTLFGGATNNQLNTNQIPCIPGTGGNC
ncbi:hypothetical protein IPF86_03115 [Candidatus Nomurabacteria bacterium]|jgi:uncharacterized membrane protein|nr:MAG: hypothetical protein IPF86_03115 [Candidatus Nomurabacteria bacterium]